VVFRVVLYLINNDERMAAPIKTIINVVVVLAVCAGCCALLALRTFRCRSVAEQRPHRSGVVSPTAVPAYDPYFLTPSTVTAKLLLRAAW
jgi:hypothetical protein